MSTGAPSKPGSPPPMQAHPFDSRLACGLLGVLLAAMMAGLNNRVVSLGLPDIYGHFGWGQDEASWLNSAYAAGELAAMPFATWFAITFSMRRFQLLMLSAVLLIALVLPLVHDLPLMLGLRTIQGFCSGCQIPLLMMAALRFMPPPIRLHGLALYAMTATFSPNIAIWITALWVDRLEDWRWIYWHVIPLGLLAMALIYWGIPKMPLALPRLRQANWRGLLMGIPGLALLAIGLDQGARLDWFNSQVVIVILSAGVLFTASFLLSEWLHPAPFIKLQLLERRNLGLGFSIFFCLLIAMLSAASLPASSLGHLQGFRVEQIQPIGLSIGLPQLLLGPAVALLLYRKWVDARYLFALGLLCISAACWLASGITSDWMVAEFNAAEILQAIGQPMAVVSLLFLGTSVVQPMEGPYVAGIINTLRAFGTLFGSATVGRFITLRSDFHHEMLLDQAGQALARTSTSPDLSSLAKALAEQASTLAMADAYRLLGGLCLLLIPFVLLLQYIPAPVITTSPSSRG